MNGVFALLPWFLLFQMMSPLMLGIVIRTCVDTPSQRYRLSLYTLFGLQITAVILGGFATGYFVNADGQSQDILLRWNLPVTFQSTICQQIVWELSSFATALMLLTPLTAMSALLWTNDWNIRRQQAPLFLILMSPLQVFWVGADIGSMAMGGFFSVFILSWLMTNHGGESRRSSAQLFLTVQWSGMFLLISGIGVMAAVVSHVLAAPTNTPQSVLVTIPHLISALEKTFAETPVRRLFFSDLRGIPLLVILSGFATMSAIFPLHGWLTRVLQTSSVAMKIWLVVWMKATLLAMFSLIWRLDSTIFQDLQPWGCGVALVGLLYSAALLYQQSDLDRFLAAAIVWSQSLTLMVMFLAPTMETTRYQVHGHVTNVIVAHLAGLALLTLATCVRPDVSRNLKRQLKRNSTAAGEGEEHLESVFSYNWLRSSVVISTAILTLTPLPIGLLTAWLTFTSEPQFYVQIGIFYWGILLFANGMALSGFLSTGQRLIQTLPTLADEVAVSHDDRLLEKNELEEPSPALSDATDAPSLSPDLRAAEDARHPWETADLSAKGARLLVFLWGLLAVMFGVVFPLIQS